MSGPHPTVESRAMRPLARLVTGILVVVLVVAAAFWWLDRRSGTDSAPDRPTATAGPSTPSTGAPSPAPTTTTPPPTTTTPSGLALPLQPRPARIAWAGDSVADTLHAAIAADAAGRGVEVVNWTVSGCGLVRGFPAYDDLTEISFTRACDGGVLPHNQAIAASGAEVVTWLSTWETANRIVDGQGYVFGTPEGDAALMGLIDESAQLLMSRGARLVFLTVAPNTTGPNRPERDPALEQRTLHLNQLLRQYAATHADRVAVLDLASFVCPSGPPCPTEVDGITLRPTDGGHFAGDGPAWVAPRVLDRLLG